MLSTTDFNITEDASEISTSCIPAINSFNFNTSAGERVCIVDLLYCSGVAKGERRGRSAPGDISKGVAKSGTTTSLIWYHRYCKWNVTENDIGYYLLTKLTFVFQGVIEVRRLLGERHMAAHIAELHIDPHRVL
ncbi:hypothetical protein AVEN_217062-1 [Araneus ventricosus]|uniref:Uncharacterized protein n=1 Tax=Araneus ventricosus TaxID=182803 RepID=A0A4Y2CAP6_ARAVE|nr:hypothetical protein AVEN_25201-1 [Araneus ventricosus]GBM00430.1 hypothetical protein AVEN_84723-1 [Araneus ventricosus]GBM00441.1 hypothetical protein AVEN_117896-1 [Araneus ventricosus]GBM00464.1 hypothetical protein AVEN_217062-1 [Araneus ventricosus]